MVNFSHIRKGRSLLTFLPFKKFMKYFTQSKNYNNTLCDGIK